MKRWPPLIALLISTRHASELMLLPEPQLGRQATAPLASVRTKAVALMGLYTFEMRRGRFAAPSAADRKGARRGGVHVFLGCVAEREQLVNKARAPSKGSIH